MHVYFSTALFPSEVVSDHWNYYIRFREDITIRCVRRWPPEARLFGKPRKFKPWSSRTVAGRPVAVDRNGQKGKHDLHRHLWLKCGIDQDTKENYRLCLYSLSVYLSSRPYLPPSNLLLYVRMPILHALTAEPCVVMLNSIPFYPPFVIQSQKWVSTVRDTLVHSVSICKIYNPVCYWLKTLIKVHWKVYWFQWWPVEIGSCCLTAECTQHVGRTQLCQPPSLSRALPRML